jgi:hypothetical protein
VQKRRPRHATRGGSEQLLHADMLVAYDAWGDMSECDGTHAEVRGSGRPLEENCANAKSAHGEAWCGALVREKCLASGYRAKHSSFGSR